MKILETIKSNYMNNLKTFLLSVAILLTSHFSFAQHNAGHNGRVLLIASNPSVNKQTGWPIGVWAAELTHPYWEFSNAGYSVDIASPDGGEIKIDGLVIQKMKANMLLGITFP